MRGKDIKMLKSKKLLCLTLSLFMIFAFTGSAFASDTVTLKINGVSSVVNINPGDTVYDVVANNESTDVWTTTTPDPTYSPLRIPSNPLYDPNANAMILTELRGLSSAPYVPTAFEPGDYYVAGLDSVLDNANAEVLAEYPNSGGLGMWYDDGYAFTANMQYMVYIGKDWTYTVNGSRPGVAITPDATHPYDFFEYYMNEAIVTSGDIIELNYDSFVLVF